MSETDALLVTLTQKGRALQPEQRAAAAALAEAGLAEIKRSARGAQEQVALTPAGAEKKQALQAAEKNAERDRKAAEKAAERDRKAAEKAAERDRKAAEKAALAADKSTTTRAPRTPNLLPDALAPALAALEERLLTRFQALLGEQLAPLRAALAALAPASPSLAAPHSPPSSMDGAPLRCALSMDGAPLRCALSTGAPASVPADPALAERVLATLQRLDAQGRFDGIIPLRAVRPALPGVSRPALDTALLHLERARKIDLQIANDPVAVPEPDAGIRIDGRGLLYYAVRHSP